MHAASRTQKAAPETYSLILYSKVGMPESSHAYNAWLHELPDPISKVVWDNYVCVSPATAASLGVSDGDVVRLEATGPGGQSSVLELPAFVQPGLNGNVVAVALGYGSRAQPAFRQHRSGLAAGPADRWDRRPGRKKCRGHAELAGRQSVASFATACV